MSSPHTAFDEKIEKTLHVPAAAFDALLLRYGAVVAGSFCIGPAAKFLGVAAASDTPSNDADIWLPERQAAPFAAALAELFNQSDSVRGGWFRMGNTRKSRAQKWRNFTFGGVFPQYARLREDVSSILVIKAPFDRDGRGGFMPRRLEVQVLACRDLRRALSSFDINICSLAWTGANLQAWAEHALSDLKSMRMRLNPVAMARQTPAELDRTVQRVLKYAARGFRLEDSGPMAEAIEKLGRAEKFLVTQRLKSRA